MRLAGQVALVTGASRGLGLAIAHALAADGAAVAGVARAGRALDEAVAGLSGRGALALAAAADVTREDEVAAAVRATLEQWGRLDIVVLNAGTWRGGLVHETPEEEWDLLLDLNLKGAFLTLKHALPWLLQRGRGTVVGIGSLGGWVGQPGAGAYAASKWGLRGLLESAALEAQPHGVRVCVVHPHNINSAGRAIAPGTDERDEHLEPGDVAALVAEVCALPDHVSVGNLTVWPRRAGIAGFTGARPG